MAHLAQLLKTVTAYQRKMEDSERNNPDEKDTGFNPYFPNDKDNGRPDSHVPATPKHRNGWVTGTRFGNSNGRVDIDDQLSTPAPTESVVRPSPHAPPHSGHHGHHHHHDHHKSLSGTLQTPTPSWLTLLLILWIIIISVKLYKLQRGVQNRDHHHDEENLRAHKSNRKVHFLEVVSESSEEIDEERLPLYSAGVGVEELRV